MVAAVAATPRVQAAAVTREEVCYVGSCSGERRQKMCVRVIIVITNTPPPAAVIAGH